MNTVVELLTGSAQRFAPATAVSIMAGVREDRWSCRRLEDFSARVARLLQEHGVSKGHRVVLGAANAPQWVGQREGAAPAAAGATAKPAEVSGVTRVGCHRPAGGGGAGAVGQRRRSYGALHCFLNRSW